MRNYSFEHLLDVFLELMTIMFLKWNNISVDKNFKSDILLMTERAADSSCVGSETVGTCLRPE